MWHKKLVGCQSSVVVNMIELRWIWYLVSFWLCIRLLRVLKNLETLQSPQSILTECQLISWWRGETVVRIWWEGRAEWSSWIVAVCDGWLRSKAKELNRPGTHA
jgi:hypothetical protein